MKYGNYLLTSIALALGNFVPGYYLRQNASGAYRADVLWESAGIFLVNMLTCAFYGMRRLSGCIVAAIFLGPFVGGGMELLLRWLLR